VNWSLVSDLGYVAALLTFVAFFMKDTIRLRQVALASNVCYAVWAFSIPLYAALLLHVALFPVNLVRLVQLIRERKLIEDAIAAVDISPAWLTGFMEKKQIAAGTLLFRRGEPADAMYFLAGGRMHLDELGIDLLPGALFGEIGIFSPDGTRMQTVRASEPSVVYLLRRHDALALYRRDPAFGIYLVRLITRRLVEDLALARATPLAGDAADASR
jgi:CRP/FNR family cyclic AMP-dependent transcriptional regulator